MRAGVRAGTTCLESLVPAFVGSLQEFDICPVMDREDRGYSEIARCSNTVSSSLHCSQKMLNTAGYLKVGGDKAPDGDFPRMVPFMGIGIDGQHALPNM